MNAEKPFIHLFRTPGGYYVYDVNTNVILKIEKEDYKYLSEQQKDTIQSKNSVKNSWVEEVKGRGFLSSKKIKEIIHPSNDLLEYYLNNKVKMITLQVTQQCNLRCEYCAYSGNYLNRSHMNARMTFEAARKSIDFIIKRSRNVESINIGFYGGEPLLEFDLMKKCINYAKEEAEGKNVTFSFTTNGTLFTKEILDFLNANDVVITISLDGPKEIHDKSRKFAVSGCGTFEKVSKNLNFFKNNYPEYFKKVAFNVVLDNKNDFGCVNDFFTAYDVIGDSLIMSSEIEQNYLKSIVEPSEDYYIKVNYEKFKLFLSKLKKLNGKHVSKLIESDYNKLKTRMLDERISTKGLPEKAHHGGPCVPGTQRLFADIHGNLYPCEKASENSEIMRIGHIDTGFNIEKVRTLLNIGELTAKRCIDCWAFRFCSLCAVSADDGTKLSASKKNSNCKGVREDTERQFRDYCTLKEFGCSFENEDVNFLVEV